MFKRKYQSIRLMGSDRPFRQAGRIVHAQELDDKGTPYHVATAVCGRTPREGSEGWFSVVGKPTCEQCKKRMR